MANEWLRWATSQKKHVKYPHKIEDNKCIESWYYDELLNLANVVRLHTNATAYMSRIPIATARWP